MKLRVSWLVCCPNAVCNSLLLVLVVIIVYDQLLHYSCYIIVVTLQLLHYSCYITIVTSQLLHYSCYIPGGIRCGSKDQLCNCGPALHIMNTWLAPYSCLWQRSSLMSIYRLSVCHMWFFDAHNLDPWCLGSYNCLFVFNCEMYSEFCS